MPCVRDAEKIGGFHHRERQEWQNEVTKICGHSEGGIGKPPRDRARLVELCEDIVENLIDIEAIAKQDLVLQKCVSTQKADNNRGDSRRNCQLRYHRAYRSWLVQVR